MSPRTWQQKHDSIHPAIPMRSATRDFTTEKNYAHTKTRKVQNTIEHQGSTKKHQNECARNRLTHELPFIAACSHFTRKNTRFRANTNPMQHSCSHYNALVLVCAVKKPHTTLHDVLLWAAKSHTTLHDVLLCAVRCHATLHDVLLCALKSHATFHDVLLCDVNSYTALYDVLLCDVKSLE